MGDDGKPRSFRIYSKETPRCRGVVCTGQVSGILDQDFFEHLGRGLAIAKHLLLE